MALFSSCKDEYVEVEKPKIYRFEYEAEDWEWEYNDDKTVQFHEVRNSVTANVRANYLIFCYVKASGSMYQMPFSTNSLSYYFVFEDYDMGLIKQTLDGYVWTQKSDEDFVIYIMDPEYTENLNVQSEKSVIEFLSKEFPQDVEILNEVSLVN